MAPSIPGDRVEPGGAVRAKGRESKAELSNQVADLIGVASRMIRRAAHRDFGPLGVTPGQMRALRTIARRGGVTRMSDLADDLRIARRSATSVVDDLEAEQLVQRSADPEDRRGVLVSITPKGSDLLETITDRHRVAASEITASLSRDELEQLRGLLRLVCHEG